MEKGTITKVSGPLVIAEGLENAKMFDLVKVGSEKLFGEIIEIKGGNLSIQVYEETTGLGVGDEVITTGSPLSVELGPGLLGAIFDGTQRPLDVIKKETGNFIKRGTDVNPLSRSKKWFFKPLIKKGEVVNEGDIIGEVAERKIRHFIMIPPTQQGIIKEIKTGEFRIEDTVAVIETKEGKTINLNMISKWPVRKGRPFKSKLRPDEPLITGQRIIDTFFPIAKGGTATVPGPFGAGKCMTGDTPVLLGNGKILPIKQVYELNKDKGQTFIKKNEAYTILDKPLKVFSFKEDKICEDFATSVYKGKTNQLVKITTQSGRKVTVTPAHKFLKFRGDLSFSEEVASKLKVGDYLALPRLIENKKQRKTHLPLPSNLKNLRVVDPYIKKKIVSIVDDLAKIMSKKTIAKKTGVSYQVFFEFYSGRNNPTFDFVKRLFKLAKQKPYQINKLKGEKQSLPIKIPQKIDKRLAAFWGLILADGAIKNGTIFFYNNDENLLIEFEKLVKNLFEIEPKRGVANTVKCSYVHNRVLAKWLCDLGFPQKKKSRNCYVPEFISNAPPAVVGIFLSYYFFCDGYILERNGEIEYASASEQMQIGLSYLFAKIGLVGRLKEKTYNNFHSYRLFISGYEQIKTFYSFCPKINNHKLKKIRHYLGRGLKKSGFCKINAVPLSTSFINELYNKFNQPYKLLKDKGVEIHNYLNNTELLSKRILQKLGNALNYEPAIRFADNHLNHIFLDKIINIEIEDKSTIVYDLEVPSCQNFVGGFGPMILHNTVIQHMLAKWANSEIIVFIGVGERGNEMTDALMEFAELTDPKTGEKLLNRTVFIANTSNMPVAAREASIYTGMAMAEYFRDMGYNVSLQADSTSRWAEAIREISGRLEEMPGEEGYPAYLASRLAQFYERAGKVKCLSTKERIGSISAIGSVSPPGGDLSEPVVQNTLRVVKVFWSLEDTLAFRRHFPAINWLSSYSLYVDSLRKFFKEEVASDFNKQRNKALVLLQKENDLLEIVRLVGMEALSVEERLIIETARLIREDFLQQNAFEEDDMYTSLKKQYRIIKLINTYYDNALRLAKEGVELNDLLEIPLKKKIATAKYVKEDKLDELEKLEKALDEQLDELAKKIKNKTVQQ